MLCKPVEYGMILLYLDNQIAAFNIILIMYGIINKSIKDLVTTKFGSDKWEEVLKSSGINIEYFLSNEPYDDEITYKLAHAVARVVNITVDDVFLVFGEWWVIKTCNEKYAGLMQSGGNSLREFLINLPLFHNRIMLIYPKLTPPEFKISEVGERSIQLHYFSKRQGLQQFVKGLLQGLSKMYETPAQIDLVASRKNGNDHEIFKVSW